MTIIIIPEKIICSDCSLIFDDLQDIFSLDKTLVLGNSYVEVPTETFLKCKILLICFAYSY